MRRIGYAVLLTFLALWLIGCSDGSLSQLLSSVTDSTAPADVATAVAPGTTKAEPTASSAAGEADGHATSAEPTSGTDAGASGFPPTDMPDPTAVFEGVFYNLPPVTLTSATGLYASPNRGEYIVQAAIPSGETVYAMGRNATSTHLRVVWSTGVGWVQVSFTDYNGQRKRLEALPVFTREPPRCAIPITTQFSLNSHWTSDGKQRVAVVVDLFRSRPGPFPVSFLSLTLNGKEVAKTRRQIVERGQFSLKDVVFTLPGYVKKGDNVGYLLDTASDEPLAFTATIFSIPEGCIWDTK